MEAYRQYYNDNIVKIKAFQQKHQEALQEIIDNAPDYNRNKIIDMLHAVPSDKQLDFARRVAAAPPVVLTKAQQYYRKHKEELQLKRQEPEYKEKAANYNKAYYEKLRTQEPKTKKEEEPKTKKDYSKIAECQYCKRLVRNDGLPAHYKTKICQSSRTVA